MTTSINSTVSEIYTMSILPLNNEIFIEIEILSAKTSGQEMKNYQQAVREYQRDLKRAENMALHFEDEEPEEPNFEIEYRKTQWNISDKKFHMWYVDYDSDRDCQVIILEYFLEGELEQISIKTTESEWRNLLIRLGATHIK